MMTMTTATKRREVNWCSFNGHVSDCFAGVGDPIFRFDDRKVNLPMLLVMSGVAPSYLAAHENPKWRGKVPYGWDFHDGPGVTVYIWNPDPEWYKDPEPEPTSMQKRIEELIQPHVSIHDQLPPWKEESDELWIDGLPFDCASLC